MVRSRCGKRCALIERWHGLILDNADDLARIMTAKHGKPLAEVASEIAYAATFVKWFAEEGCRVGGYDVPARTTNRRVLV